MVLLLYPDAGLSACSVVRNLPANAGDSGSIPGLGRSPGGGNGNPVQYSCLGNLIDGGAWRTLVHGIARVGHDWVTKQHLMLLKFFNRFWHPEGCHRKCPWLFSLRISPPILSFPYLLLFSLLGITNNLKSLSGNARISLASGWGEETKWASKNPLQGKLKRYNLKHTILLQQLSHSVSALCNPMDCSPPVSSVHRRQR